MIAPDIAREPMYMYFSTFHWHPLVNGYSGFSPKSYQDLIRAMADFPDDDTLRISGAEESTTSSCMVRSCRRRSINASSRAWTSDRTCTSIA